MSVYTETELQKTVTGITPDYFNELVPFDYRHQISGISGVVEILHRRPMLTYEGRRDKVFYQYRDDPQSYDKIGQMYEVTEANRGVVGRINFYVSLMNRAAKEDRLTDALYKRLYKRLLALRDAPKTRE